MFSWRDGKGPTTQPGHVQLGHGVRTAFAKNSSRPRTQLNLPKAPNLLGVLHPWRGCRPLLSQWLWRRAQAVKGLKFQGISPSPTVRTQYAADQERPFARHSHLCTTTAPLQEARQRHGRPADTGRLPLP